MRGSVLLYAVTAVLLAAYDPGQATTLLRLIVLAVLFYAAYRYNLATAAGAEGQAEAGGVDARKIAAACGLLLLFNLLPAAPGGGSPLRDNLALLLVGLAFFATRPLVREYGFLAAWGAFNAWLAMTSGFSHLLAPLFIIAACHHRFAVAAYALGEGYDCPGHGDTPVARRTFAGWTVLALLLFVPLQLWGWHEDRRIHPPLTAEEIADHRAELERAQAKFPAQVGVIAVGMLVIAFVMWRQLRQRRKRGAGESELQAMLSAQGYVRPLADQPPARRHFPGGPRGQVLKLYDKLLAATEKKLKQDLRCLTPAQREEQLRRLDGMRAWGEVTEIYNRARYSGGEITAADVAAVRRCAN